MTAANYKTRDPEALYAHFISMARDLSAAGETHLSYKLIVESIRAESKLKINNNDQRALMDRLTRERPDLAALFVRRDTGRGKNVLDPASDLAVAVNHLTKSRPVLKIISLVVVANGSATTVQMDVGRLAEMVRAHNAKKAVA